MRSTILLLALLASAVTSACAGGPVSADAARRAVVPAAVGCGDAGQLRQHAIDDRRLSAEQSSDQRKVTLKARANFFVSLAAVAELSCKVTLATMADALRPALDAARNAERASSFYDAMSLWGDADHQAMQVLALLIRQLPTLPSTGR